MPGTIPVIRSASAGDVNGDGVDDVIIGAVLGDPNGVENAGESYIVFGVSDTPVTPPSDGPDNDQFENARFLDSADKALTSRLTLTVKGTTVNATAQSGEPAHFQGEFGSATGAGKFHLVSLDSTVRSSG